MPLTVVTNVDDSVQLMQEEIFGSVLPVLEYERLDDALAVVRRGERPLSLYAFGLRRRSGPGAEGNACRRRHVQRLGLACLPARPAVRRHRQLGHGRLPRRRGLPRAVARQVGVQAALLVPDRAVLSTLREHSAAAFNALLSRQEPLSASVGPSAHRGGMSG